jgi:hypothetical protein
MVCRVLEKMDSEKVKGVHNGIIGNNGIKEAVPGRLKIP